MPLEFKGLRDISHGPKVGGYPKLMIKCMVISYTKPLKVIVVVPKREGPKPYLMLRYVKWVLCNVFSVMHLHWQLAWFICMKHLVLEYKALNV